MGKREFQLWSRRFLRIHNGIELYDHVLTSHLANFALLIQNFGSNDTSIHPLHLVLSVFIVEGVLKDPFASCAMSKTVNPAQNALYPCPDTDAKIILARISPLSNFVIKPY